jgi:heat shock protein HslJ
MRIQLLLLGGVLALAACAHEVAPTVSAPAARTTAGLLNTYWRLTELGGQQITTPAGARELHMVLSSENQRVSGFSGCNRMMGGYVLAGDTLKFDQLAGTMMACAGDMETEKRFLAMFSKVGRWEITGETLRLLDTGGTTVARFQARPQPPQ